MSMEGLRSRAVILKAGIPLVISVAGFIWAKVIAARRRRSGSDTISETSNGVDSGSCDEEQMDLVPGKTGFRDEVLGLGRVVEILREREWKLEMRFLRYCELRDREALLLEIGNALELELGRVEALTREVSVIEAEHKRTAEISLEYAEVLEEVRRLMLENGATRRKVKKLQRQMRGQAGCAHESSLRIEAQEREISTALESERDAVKRLEGEIGEMRRVLEQLQREKDDLQIKLRSMEESVLKVKQEGASMEDFKQLMKELEHLQHEQATEEKELIYLRWSNACLRHEMMRNSINRSDDHGKGNLAVLEEEEEAAAHGTYCSDHEGPSSGTKNGSHRHFWRRKKLLQKLRKWVD